MLTFVQLSKQAVPDWVKRAQTKNIDTLVDRDAHHATNSTTTPSSAAASPTTTHTFASSPTSSATPSVGPVRSRPTSKVPMKQVTRAEYRQVYQQLALVRQQQSELDQHKEKKAEQLSAAQSMLREAQDFLSMLQQIDLNKENSDLWAALSSVTKLDNVEERQAQVLQVEQCYQVYPACLPACLPVCLSVCLSEN
jgi:hypothetical protein